MATATRKRTTLADLMAAAKVGAIDPSTEVITAEDAEARSVDDLAAALRPSTTDGIAWPTERPSTEHDCAIPGCRHGAAHGPSQPDRQLKLACETCGAVARMTKAALDRAGGMPICADGGAFAVAARRTYARKGN